MELRPRLPARLRATLVTVMFCGFPLGSTLGGVLSTGLIDQFGWHSVFVVGGVLPLLLVAPIERREQIELAALLLARRLGIADVLDQSFDIGFRRIDVGALKHAGQKRVLPVLRF